MFNQSHSIPSITFFYPSKIVGGAEFLYIRLAKFIAENTSIPVYVFDYKDGFLSESLKSTLVNILDYTDDSNVVINYETIVITPFCHLFKTNEFSVTPNFVRVFYWSIHPTHFTNFFLTRNWFLGENRHHLVQVEFVHLIEKNAMVFMDYPNYLENKKKLKLPFSEKSLTYLPICCDLYEGVLHQYHNKESINVCWLGRIAIDKVAAIENFAWHLNNLDNTIKRRIKFTIIGNGEEEERMLNFMKKLDLNFEHKSTTLGNELNSYMVNHVDIGVAMGTSLLEFAKLRIPVVMVDIMDSTEYTEDNNFRWLHETEGFSMGDMYNSCITYKHSIHDIFECVLSESKYNEIATLCFNYYLTNHALPSISNKLIEMAGKSQVMLPDKGISKITNIMNPWYFKAIKRVKNML